MKISSQSLLDRRGPLDDQEWADLRTRTVIGERIVLPHPPRPFP